MIKKHIQTAAVTGILLLTSALPAFAHVIVSPKQVGVAAFQEFSMAVPTEKDNPTVGVKLMIPDGLQMVVPNAKAGWTINVVKNGTGDSATVTEIDWTGGSIPVGQRDTFFFQAQVPIKETTLKWKAIQQYQDGSTMSWTHDPTSNPEDDSAPPPYSITKVVNDITTAPVQTTTMSSEEHGSKKLWLAFAMSAAALGLSVVALGKQLMKKK